jgi:hypothetical protein
MGHPDRIHQPHSAVVSALCPGVARVTSGRPRPSPTTTGAVTRLAAVPPAGARRSGCWPADGESSGWSTGYLPVVRRARVGLLPSRSGRIAMYAAAINRPSPPTRSPEGARPSRADGVITREWGLCRPARPRRSPSTSRPPRAPSSPCRSDYRRPPRPEPGQPWSQELIVIGAERGTGTAMGFRVLAGFLLPVCSVLALRPAGSPIRWRTGCSPHRDEGSVKVRLETVADGLAAPFTRVPEAKRRSPCR